MISVHRDQKNIGNAKRYAREFHWVELVDMTSVADAISRVAWSPCRWRDGARRRENFLEAQLVGLDFDDGMMTLEEARNVFCDSAHVIGTTKSHRLEKGGIVADRFRVVLQLEHKVVCAETYRATVGHLIRKYDCDSACADAGRFFWPCREIVSVATQGYAHEIVEPPAIRPAPRRYREFGVVRRRTIMALARPFAINTKNGSCFTAAKDLYDAGWGEDEIFHAIVNSPTYGGIVGRELADEIWGCIRSGIISVDTGRAYGRDEGRAEQGRGPHGGTKEAGQEDPSREVQPG